jgi:hypothetical protein
MIGINKLKRIVLRTLHFLERHLTPYKSENSPPNTIPVELISAYTQDGNIPILYWYFNDSDSFGNNVNNNRMTYIKAFIALKTKIFRYYGKDMQSFYQAFKKYSFQDKTVLIWGLTGCNCDAMALWQGANKVFVVDYNSPICKHRKITVLSHQQLAEQNIKTDIAISFSSFEHDGLGRYGDSLNPNGDIKAMQEARKYLKDDGLLFLGVPQGPDCIVWNAHRIYGKKRLPLLLDGWETLDMFLPKLLTRDDIQKFPLGKYDVQPLLVLRKIYD